MAVIRFNTQILRNSQNRSKSKKVHEAVAHGSAAFWLIDSDTVLPLTSLEEVTN